MKKTQSLVSKLCAIMRAVSKIEKRGFNELSEYAYAREGEVKEAFRAEFYKRRVFPAPTVVKSWRYPVMLHLRNGDVESYVIRLRVLWTFYDGDGDAPIPVTVECEAEDGCDKAASKAITGSLKSALLSSFLIRSGEDPDADSKTTAKEVREKKLEAAQKVGEAKANGTFAENGTYFPLWYCYPPEFNGHYAVIRGTDDALAANKEPLMGNGKFVASLKGYKVPHDKMSELAFVFEQMKVPLKQVSGA